MSKINILNNYELKLHKDKNTNSRHWLSQLVAKTIREASIVLVA
jgi:hypothetical protein